MEDRAAELRRYHRVAQVFSPGAPIDTYALFAGRTSQVLDVINAIGHRGQHVVLYGERGVGKTSLANVLSEVFATGDLPNIRSVRVNCNTSDDFYSLWGKVLRDLSVQYEIDAYGRKPSPEDVRYILQDLEPKHLIVIDELDRLENNDALTSLADTVKTLSDHSVESTLVLVGVADSIDDLIGDHRSIERALVQVPMPRMSLDELTEILDKGLGALDLEIEEAAKDRVARLSEGLPYYAHLLALHAAQRAVMDDRNHIKEVDVENAITLSVEKAQHSIQSAYQKATRSPRPNLFPQVLLACALARKDDLGFFTAGGVREPMSRIMGKLYDIPAFARHLDEFTKQARGSVLVKSGEPRRFFYRFENPQLQPYVILNGLSTGMISETLLRELQGLEHPDAEDGGVGGWPGQRRLT